MVCPGGAGCRGFVARSAVLLQRKYKNTESEKDFDGSVYYVYYIHCLLYLGLLVSSICFYLSIYRHT